MKKSGDVDDEMLNDENEQREYEGKRPIQDTIDYFEEMGIDIKSLKGRYVILNVGKTKISGRVLQVNERYGLVKVLTSDGYEHVVRLGKVSDIAVKKR
jgi:hypothetical protein